MFEVSIILPSRNRWPLNLLTLYSLKKQTFNLSKMEVILIDDGSTDNTPQLKDYQPPYSFKYVRNKTSLGVSRARNIGLSLAQGEIIIFLDAETMVGPDYVSRHYQHHLNNEQNAAVVGINKSRVFTFLYPRFNQMQLNWITRFFKNRPIVRERILQRLSVHDMSTTQLQDLIRGLKKPVPLIDRQEVGDQSLLNSFSKKISNPLVRYLEDYPGESCLSWMACFGSNHSFTKSLISEIGGYDEEFKLWGMEDVEFGYRLYRAGAKYIIDPDIARFHQEHPMAGNKDKNNIINTVLFEKKHPNLDACIRSLLIMNIKDFFFFENVLREHESLLSRYPGHFREFNKSLVQLLKLIPILILEKKEPFNLLIRSGIGKDRFRRHFLFSQRNRIADLGEYNNLVRLFDMLIGL